MITKEKVIQRIQAQIALCKEIDSDWISLTVGTGKRILELLDDNDEWIDCETKMPAVGQLCFGAVYGTDVIVPMEGESIVDAVKRTMNDDPRTVVCEWYGESDGWWADGGLMIIEPRFWKPIHKPKPPKVLR